MTIHPIQPNDLPDSGVRCSGVLPLRARVEPWMQSMLFGDRLDPLVTSHGSPLNILFLPPMERNIAEIASVASDRGLDFRVFFARKANKCLSAVDVALASGAGIDTASEDELRQAIDRGAKPSDLICTAAIKDASLLALCAKNRITVAVDNPDELRRISMIAAEQGTIAPIAIRLSGFGFEGSKLRSRFGFDIDTFYSKIAAIKHPSLRLEGLHFHLDGYSAAQRVSAIDQCLPLIDRLRGEGHPIQFLDIGGGFPTNYLESEHEWLAFWEELRAALLGQRDSITYQNHGLGMHAIDGKIFGIPNTYPCYQSLVGPMWLAKILNTCVSGQTIADAIRGRDVQLRCEPGRRLMDGCGMTIARVEYRKRNTDGDWLIGLSMNGTQCRTSHDDFLVDPILIPSSLGDRVAGQSDKPIEGYVVGAYCTEFDFISLRKLRFPSGIEIGDLIAFPNTAGYLMHFLESRSHQFSLAKNILVGEAPCSTRLDDIDL